MGIPGSPHRSVGADRVGEISADFIGTLTPETFDAARYRSAEVMLTRRERQIARLVAEGYSNQKVATQLVLSVRTVESHLHRVMRKTGVSNRRALAAYITESQH